MAGSDRTNNKVSRSEAKRIVREALADAKDTPVGTLGISTDDAIERGKNDKH